MIANCSAHRPPTEMFLYFLKSSGQYLSIEYKLISVGGLWAEQFALIAFVCIVLDCIAFYCFVLNFHSSRLPGSCLKDQVLYCIVLHCIFCIVLHCIAWYCMELHGIAMYCRVCQSMPEYARACQSMPE